MHVYLALIILSEFLYHNLPPDYNSSPSECWRPIPYVWFKVQSRVVALINGGIRWRAVVLSYACWAAGQCTVAVSATRGVIDDNNGSIEFATNKN